MQCLSMDYIVTHPYYFENNNDLQTAIEVWQQSEFVELLYYK
jgi:hypothetical protein